MSIRNLSDIDQVIDSLQSALATLYNPPSAKRPTPGFACEDHLTDQEKKRSASLMRVNHTGEVCAQALYRGQALTANLPDVREEMEQAAVEEADHLAWCDNRLSELDSRASLLNPIFYGLSFGLGATAGLISDKVSLGFVAATEDQVCEHLRKHQQALPGNDKKSRAIVDQMLIDEEKHGNAALEAGGIDFPDAAKKSMTLVSKVMTGLTAKI